LKVQNSSCCQAKPDKYLWLAKPDPVVFCYFLNSPGRVVVVTVVDVVVGTTFVVLVSDENSQIPLINSAPSIQ
jgi:hypothetical protein